MEEEGVIGEVKIGLEGREGWQWKRAEKAEGRREITPPQSFLKVGAYVVN